MTIEEQPKPLTLADLTPQQLRGYIVESFYKRGRTIDKIADEVWFLLPGVGSEEEGEHAIEDVIRADMKHLAEVEALAVQGPFNLSAALDEQVTDAMHAADASPWARGFRCGYATAKAETSMAVGHLGNSIVARSEGLTREATHED